MYRTHLIATTVVEPAGGDDFDDDDDATARVAAASRSASCTICSTGIPNAPVFPLPVSAAARTSPPPSTSGIASDCGVVPYEATSGWGSQASEAEFKGVEGGDCERGTLGGETRREKSLRIGVHHADAVVRGPVYRSHLHRRREQPSFAVRDADELGAHAELLERGHDEEDRRDERAKRPERG